MDCYHINFSYEYSCTSTTTTSARRRRRCRCDSPSNDCSRRTLRRKRPQSVASFGEQTHSYGVIRRRQKVPLSLTSILCWLLISARAPRFVYSFAPERSVLPSYFWGTGIGIGEQPATSSSTDLCASRRSNDLPFHGNRGFGSGDDSGRRRRRRLAQKNGNSTIIDSPASDDRASRPTKREIELEGRVTQLEQLLASQTFEIQRLKDEVKDLTKAAEAFARVVELLRQSGLQTQPSEDDAGEDDKDGISSVFKKNSPSPESKDKTVVAESFDDSEIFGEAPATVIEAADVAGSSILAAILGGKQRLLVDVRDADLSNSAETLVQFIELAVLPVAAGLEGLNSKRNRLKIVFPTVSQLLQYRKTMALAAPEVVALSTLGFDPVEQDDNLVVIISPAPDDAEGLEAMNELLEPTDPKRRRIDQPVVVLNHHMVPISGPAASFDVAYHLRLLAVQYVAGDSIPEALQQQLDASHSMSNTTSTGVNATADAEGRDAAVEAAMEHAQAAGSHFGVTRAMVIRAYPKPWHVFVDTSPDSDADFEVAATFTDEPTQEQVNGAIVACLEGSEEEDEIVAQQMQEAFEQGQIDRAADIFGGFDINIFDEDDDEDHEGSDDDWDLFNEDSV